MPIPTTSLEKNYFHFWNPDKFYYDIDPTRKALEQAAYNKAHTAYIHATEKLFSATHDPLATEKFMPLAPTPEETKKVVEKTRTAVKKSEDYSKLARRMPSYLHEFNPFGY